LRKRISQINRKTNETDIALGINLDGTGNYDIKTGNGMFDHLLAQLSRHGLIDINLLATGDLDVGFHHLVEDVGIVLGRSIQEAVGDASGITRVAHSYVPLDEALALTVVDFGGRGYAVIELPLTDSDLGGLSGDLINHFLDTLAREGRFNLHVRILSGTNNHHIAESVFKSLARSIRQALKLDDRLGSNIPSTKGTIG
tara:strand:- start:9365 stop:9961 length:597 start_codon:yes stop_codon:yes gene_type:complete